METGKVTNNVTGIYDTVMLINNLNEKLSVRHLAEALYQGTPHLQNLAEKLSRQHGKADALTWFVGMGEDVQNFWMHIAQQIVDHSKEWMPNKGSACVLRSCIPIPPDS